MRCPLLLVVKQQQQKESDTDPTLKGSHRRVNDAKRSR